MGVKTLVIDNYDSYTYNLFQLISEVNGETPDVVFNDGISWIELQDKLSSGKYHNVVISPGPGTPSRPADIDLLHGRHEIASSLVVALDPQNQAQMNIPILGVCLGFQALALAHGARVTHAPEPVHGRLSAVAHAGHPLFKDIPSGVDYQVVRYHSLLVDEPSLPPCLQPLAWTEGRSHALNLPNSQAMTPTPSNPAISPAAPHQRRERSVPSSGDSALLMALCHRSLPHYGVQFHPESVATGYGPALLRNFRDLTAQHWGLGPQRPVQRLPGPPGRAHPPRDWPPAAELDSGTGGTPPEPAAPSTATAETNAAPGLGGSPPGEGAGGSVGPTAQPGSAGFTSSPRDLRGSPCGSGAAAARGSGAPPEFRGPEGGLAKGRSPLGVLHLRVPGALGAAGGSERLFWELFGGGEDSFWLDSATVDRGRFSFMGGKGGPLWRRVSYTLPPPPLPNPSSPSSRPAGRLPTQAAADVAANGHALSATAGAAEGGAALDGDDPVGACGGGSSGTKSGSGGSRDSGAQTHVRAARTPPPGGSVVETDARGRQVSLSCTLWSYLEERLQRLRCGVSAALAEELPFDFWGGYVGYLGYELKAECGGRNAHRSPLPDASLFLADRLLAVDHHTGDVYAVALHETPGGAHADPAPHAHEAEASAAVRQGEAPPACASNCCGEEQGGEPEQIPQGGATHSCGAAGTAGGGAGEASSKAQAQAWVADVAARVAALAGAEGGGREGAGQGEREQEDRLAAAHGPPPAPFRLRHGRVQYMRNVEACQQALHDGESYEVCLTTQLSRERAPPAQALYSTLRAVNPAPYAAWLSFGGGEGSGGSGGAPEAGFQVCCSSPERFLRLGRGGVLEAKPIKGTAPRSKDPQRDAQAAAELAASEKDRAENLMIVDLLRNDLGRVCEAGSVHVPGLMEIESYATVHQMVSTVRGLRREGLSAVDCIRAAFPGGSMTGAPKIRTMEILDALEGGPRAVYSGSIGFIGLNDTFDLNIVIRTAVIQGERITIGAGGAIVVQSDPQGEYEEMRLKAKALLRAIGMSDGSDCPAPVDES